MVLTGRAPGDVTPLIKIVRAAKPEKQPWPSPALTRQLPPATFTASWHCSYADILVDIFRTRRATRRPSALIPGSCAHAGLPLEMCSHTPFRPDRSCLSGSTPRAGLAGYTEIRSLRQPRSTLTAATPVARWSHDVSG